MFGFVLVFSGERRGKSALFPAAYFFLSEGKKKKERNHLSRDLLKPETIFNRQLLDAQDGYFSSTGKELKLMEGKVI